MEVCLLHLFSQNYFRQNDILSFGKLRASVARVGSDIDALPDINQTYTVGLPYRYLSNIVQYLNTIPNSVLKPTIIYFL